MISATPRTSVLLLFVTLALAGCGARMESLGLDNQPTGAAPLAQPTGAPFDQPGSAAAMARASAAEAQGDIATAIEFYRNAALAWPGNVESWERLADLAQGHDEQEFKAAIFIADRVAQYPADALYVQRSVSQALRLYAIRQTAVPEHNPKTVAYASRLADFYETRLAARGVYEPPGEFANIERGDLPAVLITGAAMAGYTITLLMQ